MPAALARSLASGALIPKARASVASETIRKRVAARSAGPAGANAMARPDSTSRAPSVWCHVRIAGDGPTMPVGFAQRSGFANSSTPVATVAAPRTRDRTGMGLLLGLARRGLRAERRAPPERVVEG